MHNGSLLTDPELRAMCRQVKMSHEAGGGGQTLSLDVSGLDQANLFFNHLVASVPSGDGMLKLDSFGLVSAQHQGTRIVAVIATGPVENHRPFEYGGQKMMIPSTKPGWLLSLFKAKSCKFA